MKTAILVTSYNTGFSHGKNLGVPGYSYDALVDLYEPLLGRVGEVVRVGDPRNLEAEVQLARQRNRNPVHLAFSPLQDVAFADSVPNIVLPMWEFPDIPREPFDNNPQNDWLDTSRRCDTILVSGPFTRDTLRRGGVRTPIHIVPVPTPAAYFRIPAWQPGQTRAIACRPQVLDDGMRSAHELRKESPRNVWASVTRLPFRVAKRLMTGPMRCAVEVGMFEARKTRRLHQPLPLPGLQNLNLAGVVFTSIFNQADGRKNWKDLLTGFLTAMKDKPDATLVAKLVCNRPSAVREFLNFYRGVRIPHRCRLVVIREFLSEQQMADLAAASTYYITTTHAEGSCLPLMNYLAAGRPAVAPCHTAIADYFDGETGFVVESHPEAAAFPHDPSLRWQTTRHRMVWESLVRQIRESYRVAKEMPDTYRRMADAARERMLNWSSTDVVGPKLRMALEQVTQSACVTSNAA